MKESDCIGLVGKNGAGKTTLLKVLTGLQPPTTGNVSIPNGLSVGYLQQELNLTSEVSVLEEARMAFSQLNEMQERSEKLATELTEREDYESEGYLAIIQEINDINDRLHILGATNNEEHIGKILKGLGFEQKDLSRPMSSFSGGWQMRVELAKLLLQQPDVLLLDEPTNHLDIISIQWLESFLKTYSGAIILISHDRAFLDNLTNRTVEISGQRVYDYKMAYSKYLVARDEEYQRQYQAWKNQQKYIEDTEQLINKFRAKKNKAAFAQTLIRKLEKLERIELDHPESHDMKLSFPPAPRSGNVVIRAEDLAKSYGKNQVFKDIDFTATRGQKIAIVGKNGAGKTTFSRIICDNETHDGSFEIGHNVDIGYFAQNQAEKLDPNKSVFETIDEVAVGDARIKVRTILGSFLFSGDSVDKKVKVLSGGEKGRLALCKLLLHPYNLLVLDEPTNHLDIRSKEILKQAVKEYDGTLLIVSHDRDFLDGLVDLIYEVTPTGLKEHLGSIYDFLKSKNVETLAQFEQKAQEKKEVKKESSGKNEYLERKERQREERKLKNKVSKCEREIEELEVKIKELDAVIAELDYSDQEKSSAILAEYGELKEKVENLMFEWEDAENRLAVMRMDEL